MWPPLRPAVRWFQPLGPLRFCAASCWALLQPAGWDDGSDGLPTGAGCNVLGIEDGDLLTLARCPGARELICEGAAWDGT